jgi:Cu/Zn superoxide dismutase
MKNLFTHLTAFLLMLVASSGIKANHLSDQLQFSVRATGAQQIPAVNSSGVAIGSFILSNDRSALDINLTIANLSGPIQAIHIHSGFANESGDVWMDLAPYLQGNRVKGQITGLSSGELARLINGGFYVNVHTMANPDGEVRGQISLENDQAYSIILGGNQEVPATSSMALGLGSFSVSKTGYFATLNLVVNGLSGPIMGAHIHSGMAGINGDVIYDLTPLVSGNRIEGKIDLGAFGIMNLQSLSNAGLYINIHTMTEMGGEIRGQILMQRGLSFDAALSGMTQVPMNASMANGIAVLNLNPTLDTLNYALLADGLMSMAEAAHIHLGAAGINGDVAAGLDISNGYSAVGMITGSTLSNSFINDLLKGETYINIHNMDFPGGEIRGQIFRHAREGFGFDLCGAQEVPSVLTGAYGSGVISYDRNRSNIHYMIAASEVSDTYDGAHIHAGAAGTNGDVLINFSSNLMNNTTSGYDTTITPAIATMIVNGETYVNLHNMTNPGGEIRGQVLKTGSCEIVTSIQSEASKQELEIFPNPSKNLINIRSSENIQMIRIISVDGRLIQQQKINSQQQALINIEDLNNGIYLLETVSANGNQISRIIKN